MIRLKRERDRERESSYVVPFYERVKRWFVCMCVRGERVSEFFPTESVECWCWFGAVETTPKTHITLTSMITWQSTELFY